MQIKVIFVVVETSASIETTTELIKIRKKWNHFVLVYQYIVSFQSVMPICLPRKSGYNTPFNPNYALLWQR